MQCDQCLLRHVPKGDGTMDLRLVYLAMAFSPIFDATNVNAQRYQCLQGTIKGDRFAAACRASLPAPVPVVVAQGIRASLAGLLAVIHSVSHADLHLNAFHLRKTSLGECLPCGEGKHRHDCNVSSIHPLLHAKFVDCQSSHQVAVLHDKRLMATAFLLVHANADDLPRRP